MTAGQIYSNYVRYVGWGDRDGGIFGIIKSLRIVRARSRSRRAPSGTVEAGTGTHRPRHLRDVMLGGTVLSALGAGSSSRACPWLAIVATGLLMTCCSRSSSRRWRQLHRHHGAKPGLGMTMLTIIVSSWCCCASTLGDGGDVLRDGHRGHGLHGSVGERPDHHDFKTGYWLGSTPRRRRR